MKARPTHADPGRYCDFANIQEERRLAVGQDFRRPEYRRETFLRFYEFHLKYRANPGCVYYLMPYLAEVYGWDDDAKLWFAFINGNTQNPVTSLLIFRRFPELPKDFGSLRYWFSKERERLFFDTDRRYHRKAFCEAAERYRFATLGRQGKFFAGLFRGSPKVNFRAGWEAVTRDFHTFGRLSAFSYLEYLKISGQPLECDNLFLEDLAGSKSHRNGLAKVLGRDDLDWHGSNSTGFGGRYTPEVMEWLKGEANVLLTESENRFKGFDFERDVGYFTLESCLCTYKSWHRPNRRYPNCYNDMLYGRIKAAERAWPKEDLSVFWEARKKCLPERLRLEDNPNDPGLCPAKQNWYLETGEPICMEKDWPCFANGFAEKVRIGAFGRRKE